MAFRKRGGTDEQYCIFAPMNELAPDGSVNVDGKVMCASAPNVRMAQPPTVAW